MISRLLSWSPEGLAIRSTTGKDDVVCKIDEMYSQVVESESNPDELPQPENDPWSAGTSVPDDGGAREKSGMGRREMGLQEPSFVKTSWSVVQCSDGYGIEKIYVL